MKYFIYTYEWGFGGSIVSSCGKHLALENDGLRKDDPQHIFLGNNILFSRKGCGIVSGNDSTVALVGTEGPCKNT